MGEGEGKEKAKTTYESNNAHQLVTREESKNASDVASLVRLPPTHPPAHLCLIARAAESTRYSDVNVFHFSKATRLISKEIRQDQGQNRTARRSSREGGRERDKRKEEKREKARKSKREGGRGGRGKVEKDGANS